MSTKTYKLAIFLLLVGWTGVGPRPLAAQTSEVAVVTIVDAETGRGVPLVELETIAHNRMVTDSAGRVAITAPDLLSREIFFTVRSHGYELPRDGFGYAGRKVQLLPGSDTQIAVRRINIAERWFRLTGSGIFIDSIIAGHGTTVDHPLVPGDVIGCDSVMTARYRDRLYWFWGDTLRPHYPIGGNFHMTGATTPAEFDQDAIDAVPVKRPPRYEYMVDGQQVVRSVAKMDGEGPTWLSALSVLPLSRRDAQAEVMVAGFIKVRNQLDAYRWGFAQWDDQRQEFVQLRSFDQRPPLFMSPQTHTFIHNENGTNYLYFANPLPLTRVEATLEKFIDPTQYEGYSCLQAGTELGDHQLDRDAAGQLRYAWKRNTPALTASEQHSYIDAGYLTGQEAAIQLRDVDSGREVKAHSGSVYWNAFRQRWLLITVELGGSSSLLGEVWYAEADRPEGPWTFARKVVSHEQYSFYNPKHHPFFDSRDGSTIFFEGTYTHTFSGNAHPTERYDYNQLLYRLDLRRPEMNLPVAIYHNSDDQSQSGAYHAFRVGQSPDCRVAFYALASPAPDAVAIALEQGRLQPAPITSTAQVAFYAPAHAPEAHHLRPMRPLYHYTNTVTQRHFYATDPLISQPNVQRDPEPICWVWHVGTDLHSGTMR